jgi:rRNA maturation RNase YbeY
MISFYFEDIKRVRLYRYKIRDIIKQISKDYHLRTGILNIVFCNDQYLLEINREYLNLGDFTDIITFDNCEKNVLNGELFISIDRVKENANIYAEKFENELVRVIIHGILHLVGKNDKTSEESEEMRKEENFYLDIYNKKNE